MFGRRVGKTRIVSVRGKIVIVFALFILLSNFSSNYINLIFNRSELLNLMNQLLTKDLKSMYTFCNNQYQIYEFDKDLPGSITSIEKKGLHDLKNKKAVILGIRKDGEILFQSSKIEKKDQFKDSASLSKMLQAGGEKGGEGNLFFDFNNEEYFGIYKYNNKWDCFIVRAEEVNEFYSESRRIFRDISIIIIAITVICSIIGIYVLRYIMRYITVITDSIMRMIKKQELSLINLDGATNDDITYLGAAFNSLSSTVDNLLGIFRKFANKDIVQKAYRDRSVKLEGSKRQLTIMFTDIKRFTFITEMLGHDIIKLLNMHYDRAIREIDKFDGVIGSIIGDALLAVFGAVDDSSGNKSYLAIKAAYKVHEVTDSLKDRINRIKEQIEANQGKLSPLEKQVYQACLLEVGVGIDSGEVFYGTLGSYVRMTNTVIGDTVNASSRLEGLTRIYHVPVICSETVKDEVESEVSEGEYFFLEIDTIIVKGKTTGKKIYWPIPKSDIDDKMEKLIKAYTSGLTLYYEGDWTAAAKKFKQVKLPLSQEFIERTKQKCPKNWNGVWEMKTK